MQLRFIIVVVMWLGFTSCNSETGFYSSTRVFTAENDELAEGETRAPYPRDEYIGEESQPPEPTSEPTVETPPETPTPPPPPPPPTSVNIGFSTDPISVFFNVQVHTETDPPAKRRIIFLIDDSGSMANKIARLSTSIGGLVSNVVQSSAVTELDLSFVRLSSLKMPTYLVEHYSGELGSNTTGSVRYAGLGDPYFWQCEKDGENFSITKATNGTIGVQSHREGYTLAHKHFNLTKANYASQLPAVTQYLNAITPTTARVEPMLALATSALQYFNNCQKQNIPRLVAGVQTHLVFVTDEGEDKITELYNPLLMHTSQFKFNAAYEYPNGCEAQGFADPQHIWKAYQVKGRRFCLKNGYDDTNTNYYDLFDVDKKFYTRLASSAPPSWQQKNLWKHDLTGDENEVCSVSQYECTYLKDGSPFTLTTFGEFTDKNNYVSCTRIAGSEQRLIWFNPARKTQFIQQKHATFDACHGATVDFVVKAHKYTVTYNSDKTVFTAITEDSCPSGYTNVPIYTSPGNQVLKDVVLLESPDKTAIPAGWYCPMQVSVLKNQTLAQVQFLQADDLPRTVEFDAVVSSDGILTQQALESALKNKIQYVKPGSIEITKVPPQSYEMFEDSPQGFGRYLQRMHSQVPIFAHTIANLTGSACAQDSGSGDVQKSKRLLETVELTGGAVGDICATSYQPIFNKISELLTILTIDSTRLGTLVPVDLRPRVGAASLTKVYNTTKKILLRPEDYIYSVGTIYFTPTALSSGRLGHGDRIEVVLN